MLTMNLWHIVILLSLAVNLIVCFPSRPLNERSSELAWQAWLLVDDQNGKQNGNDDAMLRRRIHPKSVFIAPTFSPTDLPPCADGYQSDNMGRCIRIIKIDEAAQLENLLHKLNADFGNPNNKNVNFNLPGINGANNNDNDYYDTIIDEEDVDESTSGPLQVNIPLGGVKEPEIAIIVAPTRNNFEDDELKIDQKREDRLETTTVADETTTTASSLTTNIPNAETSTEEIAKESTVTETTAETSSQTMQISTVTEPTVTETIASTNRLPETTLAELSTTVAGETKTTLDQRHAEQIEDEILLPGEDLNSVNDLNSINEKTSTTTEEFTETTESTTTLPETTTYSNTMQTIMSWDQKLPLLKTRTLSPPLHSSPIGVPSFEDISHQQVPRSTSNTNKHPTLETAQPTIKTAQPTIQPLSPTATIIESSSKSSHRNRDKTSSFGFYYPPSGTIRPKHLRSLTSDSSQFLSSLNLNNQVNNAQSSNKPVIFRFSGKHAYVDSQLFKQQPDYYRSLPSDDLSYLFGFKNKQITHR